MARFVALAVVASVLTTAVTAHAASCCGGGGTTDQFALSKWQSWIVGVSLQADDTVGFRDSSGRRVPGDYRAGEARAVLGAGVRLHDDVQSVVGLPLVGKRVVLGGAAGWGGGIGDVALQFRYELMDEDTCFLRPVSELRWDELKPSIHLVSRSTLPTGRSTAQSRDSRGASVTGRGRWATDAGLEVTKVWGYFGNSASLSAGRQWPTAGERFAKPALRWQAGTGVLYYPAYKVSVGLFIDHQRESTEIADEEVRSTGLGLTTTYARQDGWWVRWSAGASGGLGDRNAPVTWRGFVSLAKAL